MHSTSRGCSEWPQCRAPALGDGSSPCPGGIEACCVAGLCGPSGILKSSALPFRKPRERKTHFWRNRTCKARLCSVRSPIFRTEGRTEAQDQGSAGSAGEKYRHPCTPRGSGRVPAQLPECPRRHLLRVIGFPPPHPPGRGPGFPAGGCTCIAHAPLAEHLWARLLGSLSPSHEMG